MSSKIRTNVSKNILDKEFVSVEDKSRCLATAIYSCSKSHPFLGSVLQCLNISYSHTLPTAGILFNTDAKRWDMLINPFFFCKKLDDAQRKAVMLHELSHITHKHPIRVPFMKISPRKRMLMNIAADMAINQFIKDLPQGCPQCPPPEKYEPCPNEMCPGRCIDVKDFSDTSPTGTKLPWETNKTMEFYYEKLIARFEDPEDGDDGEGDSDGNAGGGANTKDLPDTLDEHMWDGAAEEKDMLDATEELVKRAMVKSRLSFDDLPGHIKDLLEDLKVRRSELNYKALIMSALKKHASGHDRKSTWTRISKRFGVKAPGTKVGDLPKLNMYLDTSGSISVEELNEFLDIVDNFLKVGARKCDISFFHTQNYGHKQYKIGQRIDRADIESGGTELEPVMKDILKKKADLSIVITDGCYGDVEIESTMNPGQNFPQTLFIISKGGTESHPLRRLGQTIKVPDTSSKK